MKAKVRIDLVGYLDAEIVGETEDQVWKRVHELQAATDFYKPIEGVQILFEEVMATEDDPDLKWREDERDDH